MALDFYIFGVAGQHINVYGGEERFWLGPEGEQYSIFFPAGAEFTLANWQTPPAIDTVTYPVVRQDENSVAFRHETELRNYSKTTFRLRIDREVQLLSGDQIEERLGVKLPAVKSVAYATRKIR